MNHDNTNEDVMNKYQKRRRRQRQGKKNRKTLTILSIFVVLFVTVYIVTDHRSWEERRKTLHIMRRAHQIMDARRGVKTGNKLDNESFKINALSKLQKLMPGGDNLDIDNSKQDKHDVDQLFQKLDSDIRENRHGGIRWIEDKLLKELPGQSVNKLLYGRPIAGMKHQRRNHLMKGENTDFSVKRNNEPPMLWENEWRQLSENEQDRGPKVDYTKQELFEYPDRMDYPPDEYPFLQTMNELLTRWPQDELDKPPSPILEKLIHFNFSDPKEKAMARNFRDARLPFKVYDVPEIAAAGEKWTDEYVALNFDRAGISLFQSGIPPRSNGNCQESHDNFFAFFSPTNWQTSIMGPPPYRNNDWTYKKWSLHARYADSTSLSFDQPHFYYQSGVPRSERYEPKDSWTFVSRDLPSFSANTETFFQFQPEEQKGIQCRFGERGVTAATHYDAGQNMVAMITGAKRYILSPPKECSKLGIVTARGNTLFRHSLLNFGHISHLDRSEDIPGQERGWLERSKTALAVETVLKAGEVLFIPSHWFHYIISLQKSAQCNVRSGVDEIGTRKYGGSQHVYDCK